MYMAHVYVSPSGSVKTRRKKNIVNILMIILFKIWIMTSIWFYET